MRDRFDEIMYELSHFIVGGIVDVRKTTVLGTLHDPKCREVTLVVPCIGNVRCQIFLLGLSRLRVFCHTIFTSFFFYFIYILSIKS